MEYKKTIEVEGFSIKNHLDLEYDLQENDLLLITFVYQLKDFTSMVFSLPIVKEMFDEFVKDKKLKDYFLARASSCFDKDVFKIHEIRVTNLFFHE